MKKTILLSILISSVLFGCGNNSDIKSSNDESSIKNSEISSTFSSTSSLSQSSISASKPSRPHNHKYGEWEILEEANLFNSGKRIKKCESCDANIEEIYYDLSEVRFIDKNYQYNGLEREIKIEGILPKGIKVKYKNNKLTNIGSILATAEFITDDNKIIDKKEAVLTITSYIGLPNINVTTINNAAIDSKEVYTDMTLSIDNCLDNYKLENAAGGIRLRGNGSLEAIKKPYRLKFNDKQSLLGLNDGAKIKSWVLLAEFYDYSMMRNATAFTLGNDLMNGKGYYSSDFQHVNLYVNGIFNGVYVLCEQQQVNKNRVDIYEADEDEETLEIGYLLEMDNYGDDYPFEVGNTTYTATDSNGSSQIIPTRTYSIKSDIYSLEQQKYISKYMNSVYSILYNAVCLNKYYELDENFDLVESKHIDAYSTINEVIDLDSLMRSYILEEIMKDIDVGFSSYYMFVDFSKDSKFNKLTFGAPWDFDWSGGNPGTMFNYNYGTSNGNYNSLFTDHMNPWLFLLSKLNNFDSLIKEYWNLLVESDVFVNAINQVNDIAITYKNDFNKNFQKWDVLGTSQHVYHNYDAYSVTSHLDAAKKFSSWLKDRVDYLDSKW